MFWADELAAGCAGPQVLNDSKTPSGTVHVGSLRGPVINDVIEYEVCGVGAYAWLKSAPCLASASMLGVVGRV